MSTRILLLSALGLAGLLLSGTAQACRVAAQITPYLHATLPVVADSEIAAEVEILSGERVEGGFVLKAHIIAMLKGNFSGERMKIAPEIFSSCDGVPRMGEKGIIVGRVISSSGDVLVVDPRRAPSLRESELRNSLSEPGRE